MHGKVNLAEALLLIQMAVTHASAMDLLGRSTRAGYLDHLEVLGKQANRLLRTYAMQWDALTSLRRDGKHVVEVRHVHVYRDPRKPEGTPAKKQPLHRGPHGRFTRPAPEATQAVA